MAPTGNPSENDLLKLIILLADKQESSLRRVEALNKSLESENVGYNIRMRDIKIAAEALNKVPPFMVTHKNKAYHISSTYQVNVSGIDYAL